MKNLKSFVIVIALFIGTIGYVNAQSKVAHINVQELVSQMPEMKAAQAELKKLEETYKADLSSSAKELQNKLVQYQNEAVSKTQEENKKRAEEVQGMEKNILEAEQAAGKELQKKQVELYEPILKKANDAIQKVARAQGFEYVLDASPGGGVIMADGKDLLADVKK
ncbi:OmpH family outer membrane protein [Leptobacterium sp. I13]|uniref:OmpH family outer membrane protein n=1 Tax=Leptobacterium meishanense TaxID=3128904 RepID=UPI0030EDA77F